MGLIYENKGELEKALEYHEREKEIIIRTLGENDPDLASTT